MHMLSKCRKFQTCRNFYVIRKFDDFHHFHLFSMCAFFGILRMLTFFEYQWCKFHAIQRRHKNIWIDSYIFHPCISRKCDFNVHKNICLRSAFVCFICWLWNPWCLHISRSDVNDKFLISSHWLSVNVIFLMYGTPRLEPFFTSWIGCKLDSQEHKIPEILTNMDCQSHYSCKWILIFSKAPAHCDHHTAFEALGLSSSISERKNYQGKRSAATQSVERKVSFMPQFPHASRSCEAWQNNWYQWGCWSRVCAQWVLAQPARPGSDDE